MPLLITVNAPAQHNAEPTASFEWLGAPRSVSRAWSASKDTPALELTIAPRPGYKGGGDLALATARQPSFIVRNGFAGFIALEYDGETDRFHDGPWPGARSGRILWRGAYSFFSAVTPRELGPLLCRTCVFEVALSYRHESQHYTGSNAGDNGEDVSAQPYVGDDVVLDVALSHQRGAWYFAERVVGLGFLPDRSSYAAGVGADLHARWRVLPTVHVFASLYGEYLVGDELLGRRYPNSRRASGLFGAALPSELGDILVFLTGDLGNRYGVRILTKEASVGFGVRLTIGAHPSPSREKS
jgi:hypothetical protein